MRIASIAIGSLLLVGMYAVAGDFQEQHPRRAEVNKREKNQMKRINQGAKNGKLTPEQAKQIKGEEKGIKAQERAEVKANGGHLTKGEQKQLNHELNHTSNQIKHDEHNNAGAGAGGGTTPPAPPAPPAPPTN